MGQISIMVEICKHVASFLAMSMEVVLFWLQQVLEILDLMVLAVQGQPSTGISVFQAPNGS